jgi:hypothetical protein
MNAFSGFGKKIGGFWDLVMSKRTAAPFSSGGAVISKFGIYPPIRRIMRVDNSAIPEYTIIRGANMDTDVVFELWESYFPPVIVLDIRDVGISPSKDSFVAKIKPFIIFRDGIPLLDIKGMAKVQPFKSLFPSETDPAYKHWPKLEKELEKGKPVKIIEFFIEEDNKKYKSKHNNLKIRLIKDMPGDRKDDNERREKELAPIDDDLPKSFFNKTTREYNWMYYYITENIFKYDFSDIIESYESNSIYEAFRSKVSRSFVLRYVRDSHSYNDDRIKRAIENIKGKGYYLPTRTEFLDSIVKSMKFGKGFSHLVYIGKGSAEYEVWKYWVYYCTIFINILKEIGMEEKAENLQNEAKKSKGRINRVVEFISNLINNQEFLEEYKKIQNGKIDFDNLREKINEHYKYSISLNDPVGRGDDIAELGDSLEDENNFNTLAENSQNKILRLFKLFLSLTYDELEILRREWVDYFKNAFGKDEYGQFGQANFATYKAFRRFIKWLVPYIGLHLGYYGLLDEEDTLFLDSKLFKDYCRVLEINGCKKCGMVANGESGEGCPVAKSVSGLSYDINKCATCSLKNKNRIDKLMQDHARLIRRINKFFKLIENDKKKISGEKDERKY